MEDLKQIISANISKYRKVCGLTQLELAEKLNYSDKAVSKWECGESLPDILILKEMSNIFGVSLDALTSNKEAKPKPLRRIILKISTDKFFISSASTLLVWLIASIVFVCLTIFSAPVGKIWLAFIFAIPVNCIVLLSLTKFWKSGWYNFICSSLLVLSLALSIHLVFDYAKLWLLFVLCVPLIALSFLWFVTRLRIFKVRKK